MTTRGIEKDVIIVRINGIQGEIAELEKLAATSFEEFQRGVGYQLAQYHLHRALEGVFNIASHILSKIPGVQATQYKELAVKLGDAGIVDPGFAGTRLVQMAKYRNRLVHFYAHVSPEELYAVLQNDLGDFAVFLSAIKKVLEHPEQFGLTVE